MTRLEVKQEVRKRMEVHQSAEEIQAFVNEQGFEGMIFVSNHVNTYAPNPEEGDDPTTDDSRWANLPLNADLGR